MKQTFVLEFDDLEIGKAGLDEVFRLKQHYPKMKVTFFMIPLAEKVLSGEISPADYKKWAKQLKTDWIEICPHGLTHQDREMLVRTNQAGNKQLLDYDTAKLYIQAAEHTFEELELPYKKIWKSPYWETSPDAYKAIFDMGYKIACDPNQDHPDDAYLYNWSIDRKPPKAPLVKGHGHLYGSIGNNIAKCYKNLIKIPTDVEWKFVSEVA